MEVCRKLICAENFSGMEPEALFRRHFNFIVGIIEFIMGNDDVEGLPALSWIYRQFNKIQELFHYNMKIIFQQCQKP